MPRHAAAELELRIDIFHLGSCEHTPSAAELSAADADILPLLGMLFTPIRDTHTEMKPGSSDDTDRELFMPLSPPYAITIYIRC